MVFETAKKYNLNQETIEKIYSESKTIVESLGYELVDIDYSEMYKSLQVFVIIWKKEKIQLDDCEKVHPLISDMLEKYDGEFPEKYTLNISSPGLDREIKSNDDFRRNLGEELTEVKSNVCGLLIEYDSDYVVLKNKKNEDIKIERRGNKFQPYINF